MEVRNGNWVDDLDWMLKRCKASVSITFNEHKDLYLTLSGYLNQQSPERDECPPEIRAEIEKEQRIVEVQAYPKSPVGYHIVYDCRIDRAVKRMREMLEG